MEVKPITPANAEDGTPIDQHVAVLTDLFPSTVLRKKIMLRPVTAVFLTWNEKADSTFASVIIGMAHMKVLSFSNSLGETEKFI
jgi:hypothetical protein